MRALLATFVVLGFAALAASFAPTPAAATEADLYWQCVTGSNPSWCPLVAPPGGGFRPEASASGTLAVTSTSGNLNVPGAGTQLYIANIGTKEAFVKFGTNSSVTAVVGGAITGLAGDVSIPAGLAASFYFGTNAWVAAVSSGADTTTLRVTRGWGQ